MSKYDNDANAINKRLIQIAKKYGITHPAYQNYANKVAMEQIPIWYNEAGVLQIKRSEKGLSAYQKARVENLRKKGATVSSIRSKYKKSHPDAGRRADIDAAIKAAVSRQDEINNALDTIYKYYDETVLPSDIVDKYENFRDHETSNEEIDAMIAQLKEFEEIWPEIQTLISEAESLDYLPEDIEQDIWEISSGRLTLDNLKAAADRIRDFIANGGAYDTDD